MLSTRVRTIIISVPRATAYIIINILVVTAMCFTCASYVCYSTWAALCICVQAHVCNNGQWMPEDGGGARGTDRKRSLICIRNHPIMWNGYFAIYRVFVSEIFLNIYLLRPLYRAAGTVKWIGKERKTHPSNTVLSFGSIVIILILSIANI